MSKLITALACLAACGCAQAQGATYAIDPTHTFDNYEVLHLGTSISRGRFSKIEGSFEFDRAARRGKLDVKVDTETIDTGLAMLDKQLRGKDLFDTERFPSARFVSDRFNCSGDGLSEIEGSFTLLGVTLPVTLKAARFNCFPHPFLEREVCGGDFELTLQRSRWGMTKYAPDRVGENVRLLVQVEAMKQ